jgi:hypothetical protein
MRIGFEVSFWEKVYQWKDQEPTRYAAYLSAEENLSKTFVSKTPAKTLSSFVYFANDLLLDQNDDIWRRLQFYSLVRAFPQLYTKGECVMWRGAKETATFYDFGGFG